jgi:hypothetical protein
MADERGIAKARILAGPGPSDDAPVFTPATSSPKHGESSPARWRNRRRAPESLWRR